MHGSISEPEAYRFETAIDVHRTVSRISRNQKSIASCFYKTRGDCAFMHYLFRSFEVIPELEQICEGIPFNLVYYPGMCYIAVKEHG